MKIVIATDAWLPQVNGVVTTLVRTCDELRKLGHDVRVLSPEGRRTVACPGYPEIRLSILPGRSIRRELADYDPDCVHISTEGPIGWAARRYCKRHGMPFTTAYHTRFPEYVRARVPIPVSWTSRVLRRFHGRAERTMVPTRSIKKLLQSRGFSNISVWSRGVDTKLFTPDKPDLYDVEKPIWVSMGRIAVEKNLEAFLNLDIPGTKIMIGDGPDRERLERQYPETKFLGYRFGTELSSALAGADVFVFPSKTDTFGLVMLEAMACGLPVAAYPVGGPADVVSSGVNGVLSHDLATACTQALGIDPLVCRQSAKAQSWRQATQQFLANLSPRSRGSTTPNVVRTSPT